MSSPWWWCLLGGVGVKVTDAGDLGSVVNHLAVDVQDQRQHRLGGVRALGGAARPVQGGGVEAAHPGDPAGVGLVELGERRIGVSGVPPRLVVRGRAAEVGVVAHREHADDHVGHPPRDGGERLGLRRRVREVDPAVPIPRSLRSCPPDGMHGPAVRHRLEEVLLVGEALQSWTQCPSPVEVELFGQLGGQSLGHEPSVASI